MALKKRPLPPRLTRGFPAMCSALNRCDFAGICILRKLRSRQCLHPRRGLLDSLNLFVFCEINQSVLGSLMREASLEEHLDLLAIENGVFLAFDQLAYRRDLMRLGVYPETRRPVCCEYKRHDVSQGSAPVSRVVERFVTVLDRWNERELGLPLEIAICARRVL
jgi:hypothetical protein